MAQRMVHEPFYRRGTFADEQFRLAVEWVDAGSESKFQWNQQGDVGVLLHGEIYSEGAKNDADSKRRESEKLIVRYEKADVHAFAGLNGIFSGILLDRRKRRIFLFNDRYGIGRIHFYQDASGFYFASEAKSLLELFPGLREVELQSLAEFLTTGCVLENRSLFRNVALLPAGSAWLFEGDGSLRRMSYFDPRSLENQERLSLVDYNAALTEIWNRILPLYLLGDQNIGLSLTGGVDSRMIIAWARSQKLECYTFAGPVRECADVRISRKVSATCGQPHQVIRLGNDFLDQFSRLAEKAVYISDGGMDATGAVDVYVQRVARQIAPVRVTGTNGGEMLRSIVAFKPVLPAKGLLEPGLERLARESATTYRRELAGDRRTFTSFRQAPWFMAPKFGLERSQISLRMPYFDNALAALVYRAPAEALAGPQPSLQAIAKGNPALTRIATDRDVRSGTLPGYARLARAAKEFTFRAEYAYDYGMPQWLAKLDRVLKPLHLERLFLGRHKISHFRLWYRDRFAGYLREMLLDSRTLNRGLFNREFLQKIVADHTSGRGNYTRELHKILSVELMMRLLVERN